MVSKLIAESKIPPDARLKSCQGRQKERKKKEGGKGDESNR